MIMKAKEFVVLKRDKSFWGPTVTKKERVRKHTAHWLPSTNPGVHVLLIYSTQFRPSITHNTLATYWLFQMNITRSKTYKCFASTQQESRSYNIHLLPRPLTHMPTRETLTLHYRLYTFPENTSLLSIKCSQ